MKDEDWQVVARIYGEGIATGEATFENEVPGWEQWDSGHAPDCRLVAEVEAEVAAWAALSPVSRRPVYRGVAESSIYVGANAQGRGVGTRLLAALVEASEEAGYWTLQTSIFSENQASIALHERCGFRVVGTRERIGSQNGRWRDTVLMERRSLRAGG
jgi:L-amino acid N-acyltransferase YncA